MDELTETIRTYDKNVGQYVHELEFPAPVEELDEFIRLLNGKKVLDAGCGAGRDSNYLSENGFEVTGIDLSEGMLSAAKEIVEASFLVKDIRDTGFPDEFFDGVWCYNVLLHQNATSLKSAVREFNRILKCGGLLFVSTKQGESGTPEKIHEYEKYYFLYSETYLKDAFQENGFEILSIRKHNHEDEEFIDILMRKKEDIHPE